VRAGVRKPPRKEPAGRWDRAATICFRAWLARRGRAGDYDIEIGIRQVIAFIEAHGSSRFEAAWEQGVERVINRAGFRRLDDQGGSRLLGSRASSV
jgi:hypothetical protein